MKNKKGEIGSTLTWLVATFIILFIIIIYIVVVLVLAKPYDNYSLLKNQRKDLDFSLIKKFFIYLELPVTNGNNLYNYIILAENQKINKDTKEIFKREIKKFFDLNVPEISTKEINLWIFNKYSNNFEKSELNFYEDDIQQVPEAPIDVYYHKGEFFISEKSKIIFELTTT